MRYITVMPLSEDQKRRIEENRKKALAKRKNLGYITPPNNNQLTSTHHTNQQPMLPPPGPGAAWAMSKQNQKPTSNPLHSTSLRASTSSAPGQKSTLNPLYSTSLRASTSSAAPGVIGQPTIGHNKNNETKVKGATTNQFYGKAIQAKFVLLDRQSFKVEMNYHPGAITIFKTIKSGRYNAAERTWSFSMKDHTELARGLRPLQPEVQIDPLPRWVLETFKSNTTDTAQVRDNQNSSINQDPSEPTVEPCLWDNLMPFQRDGVRYALERGGRILLADDMGLGKTIQALGIVSAYKSKWPLLIVCPSSMRFAWKSAVIRWLPSVPEEDIVVIISGKKRG